MAVVCLRHYSVYLALTKEGYFVNESMVNSKEWKIAWSFVSVMKGAGIVLREIDVLKEIDRLDNYLLDNSSEDLLKTLINYEHTGTRLCRLIDSIVHTR